MNHCYYKILSIVPPQSIHEIENIKFLFQVRPKVLYDLRYAFYLNLHFIGLSSYLDSVIFTYHIGIQLE